MLRIIALLILTLTFTMFHTACDEESDYIRDYTLPSHVMSPTINKGEDVTITSIPYNSVLDRFTIVLFRNPENSKQLWIGRIVGLPHESVGYDTNGNMTLGGRTIDAYSPPPHVKFKRMPKTFTYVNRIKHPVKLASKEYYITADNWERGIDSEQFGPVSRDKILGVARNF